MGRVAGPGALVYKVARGVGLSLLVRDGNEVYVLDSNKNLHSNRRTDFGRMKPKWFIRVIQEKLTARRL